MMQLSEQEAVNTLVGLFRLLAGQYGPEVAGELVAIAIRDAKRAMTTVSGAIGSMTDGVYFADAASAPRN